MKIDPHDAQEMRRLEDKLAALQDKRFSIFADIECEHVRYEDVKDELDELDRQIYELDTELDIVGGFNGE